MRPQGGPDELSPGAFLLLSGAVIAREIVAAAYMEGLPWLRIPSGAHSAAPPLFQVLYEVADTRR